MSEPVLEIPFLGGLDESTRDEVVDPSASFLTLENTRQNERGGAEKRLGYASLSATLADGTSRAAGYRMFTIGDQICTIDGTYLDVYSPTLGRSVVKGRVPEATYRMLEAPTLGVDATQDDVVVCNGYAAISWTVPVAGVDYGYFALIDSANGAIVRSPEKVTSSIDMEAMRLGTYGNYILAFGFNADQSRISLHYLDTTSATTINNGWQSVGNIVNGAYFRGNAVSSLSDGVAIAYVNDGIATNLLVNVDKVTIAGIVDSVTLVASGGTTNPDYVSLSEGSSTLWVAWNVGGDVNATGLDPANISGTALASMSTVVPTSTVSGTVTRVFLGPRASGNAAVYVAVDGNRTISRAIKINSGATATDGTAVVHANAVIVGTPFLRNSRLYAPFTSSLGAELVVCDCTPDTTGTVGVIIYLRPVIAPIQRELFSSASNRTAVVSSTKYIYGFVVRKSGTTTGTALVEYDFANRFRWETATANGSTYISGGVLSVFDGNRVFEAAFLVRPPKPTTDNGTGSGLTLTSGRRYVATYEEVDADGNWHVSGVSDPSAISGAMTNKKVVVTVLPISITSRGSTIGSSGSSLRTALYATADGGEPPYYRLATIANDPTAASQTYDDTTSEATLTSQAQLYGTGNLPGTGAGQDHRAPPGLLYIVAFKGMLVGLSGSTLFYSSQPIDGEGLWFSPAFSLPFQEEGTGLTVQDDSVIIFTKSSAYITSGEPPSDNGLQGGFSPLRKMSIDQGTINASSILPTDLGIFYQSKRGLELITRGQTGSFELGFQVKDTLGSYPEITAAVLDTSKGLARFSLADSVTNALASDSGVDLVFDLTLKVWISRDVKRGSTASQASQDACMATVSGVERYCWLSSAGTIYYERSSDDASAHLDGSSWVTQKAETGWIKTAGFQGTQLIDRVLLLAEMFTGHDITISIAYDYSSSYETTKTFTAAQLAALSRQWLDAAMGNKRLGQAVKVKIEDATPSSGSVGTGKGASWIVATFDGERRSGAKRTHTGQR